ncbi:MAG: amidohydrolase family protein [Dehalococcoidia bacterium]
MLVDAHVHAFPDRLALAVRARLNRDGRLQAGPLVADVADAVRNAGFDAAWLLPYAHRAGVAASLNEWSAGAGQRFPSMVAGASFHPDDAPLAPLVHRALDELGLRVVKLHCAVGAFSPADARLEPLWEAAARRGAPVVIHAGQRAPGATTADEVAALAPLLAAHRNLNVVLAHAGYPNTAQALTLMHRFSNLYADVTPVWEQRVQVSQGELTAFAGRFLFGSDAPNNPVGANDQAAVFQSIGLDPDSLALLLGGVACRLVQPMASPD